MEDGNIYIFMTCIQEMGGFEKIKFFNSVWGTHDHRYMLGKFKRLQPYVSDAITLTALTAVFELPLMQAIPAKVYDLHKVSWMIRNLHKLDVDALFTILKAGKAWSQSTLFDDVIKAIEAMGNAKYLTAILASELKDLAIETRKITSEKYQHLKGKEIGEAIDKERREVIEKLIKEF